MKGYGALLAGVALVGVAVALGRKGAAEPPPSPGQRPSGPGTVRDPQGGSSSTGGTATQIDVIEDHGVAMYGHGGGFLVNDRQRWDDFVAFTLSNLGGVPALPTLADAQDLTVDLWQRAFPSAELGNETLIGSTPIGEIAARVFDYMQRQNGGQPSTRNSHMRGVASKLRGA